MFDKRAVQISSILPEERDLFLDLVRALVRPLAQFLLEHHITADILQCISIQFLEPGQSDRGIFRTELHSKVPAVHEDRDRLAT